MAGTRRKPGALGAWVETYRSGLMRAGYTPGSVRGKLKELGHLGRWMSSRGLEVGDLDESRVEEFLADRRAGGHRRVPGLGSFVLLLEVLREQGVIADVEAPPPTPLDGLIARYRSSLVKDRGLAPATVLRYENLARRFLVDRSGDGSDVDVAGLTGSDVTVFLLAECARLSVGSAKGRVTELRSLLRFFYVEGLTPLALAAAVPPVAGWRDTGLPSPGRPTLSPMSTSTAGNTFRDRPAATRPRSTRRSRSCTSARSKTCLGVTRTATSRRRTNGSTS